MNADPHGARGPEAQATDPHPRRAAIHDTGPSTLRHRLLRSLSRMVPTARQESGAAIVELAFVLTLLSMLLVGVVTSAIAFGRDNSIENAAREASRYAATLPGPVDTSWLRDVRDVARSAALGELDSSVPGQYICVAQYDGSAWTRLTETGGVEGPQPDAQSCFTDSLPVDQPRVQIVASRDTTIGVAFFSMDVTLEGEAAARYER